MESSELDTPTPQPDAVRPTHRCRRNSFLGHHNQVAPSRSTADLWHMTADAQPS